MEESKKKVRLVRCPKCQNLLPELLDYSVYQCGGCGAVLRAKHEGYGSGSLLEFSDEGELGKEIDHVKSGNSLEKGVVYLSNNSDLDVRYGQRDPERIQNVNKKGLMVNDFDVNVNKDEEEGSKSIREKQEQSPELRHRKGSEFSGSMRNWQIGERDEMEGFWRKPLANAEGARFSTLNYPDEGTSSSYSGNYGERWRNERDMDGVSSRVEHLEKDRAELLRKLDELTNQLSQSPEVAINPKEQFRPDGRMALPPDPYGGSDAWFPVGSSSRQFLDPNRNVAGPPYLNYQRDPYAYASSHEMAMRNFHPSMHYVHGYGDPFASQMMSRGQNQLPHQFPQQRMHPYFSGRYPDAVPGSYEPYLHNAMPHAPSCPCFLCHENKRRGPVAAPPAAFMNRRFPDTPNDPMLHHSEIPGTFGPPVHSFPENPLHTRWTNELNSEMGGVGRSRPRNVVPAGSGRHCLPIAGGSPFITCYNCFELLQLPKKVLVTVKNRQRRVRCGACSSEIGFSVINKKLVISFRSEMNETSEKIDDTSGEVVNNNSMSPSNDHMDASRVNFSSDDYAGYDFHSADRESLALAAEPSLNSSKHHETQSLRSSSLNSSEDEIIPEVRVARGKAKSTKFIHQPTKDFLSPPPSGLPLKAYFEHSNSNNNHVVNRLDIGNRSGRSELEKGKTDKVTSRQNSLKEVVLATEMDVHDYSNSVPSQDCVDSSQEHDRPRSNKGGESFFASFIKKGFRDSSQSSGTEDFGTSNVTINGHPLSDRAVKKAEKLAGPIRPGNYWYDSRAGFWGVMGGPCLGIIPPFIEEFNYPMPEECAGGNTSIFVNGRELHQRDLDLLSSRGLPRESGRSYIVEISGRILDEDRGEELDSLGRLAPTVEKVKHGFGMKVPKEAAA